MKICASRESGYSALGARMDSSSSFLKGGVLLALPSAGGGVDEGAGVWASTAAVPARNTVTMTDPQIAIACFIFVPRAFCPGPGSALFRILEQTRMRQSWDEVPMPRPCTPGNFPSEASPSPFRKLSSCVRCTGGVHDWYRCFLFGNRLGHRRPVFRGQHRHLRVVRAAEGKRHGGLL